MKNQLLFLSFLFSLSLLIINKNSFAEIIYTDIEPNKELKPGIGGGQSYYIYMDSDNFPEFSLQVTNTSGYESVRISGTFRQNQVAGDGDTNDVQNFYPLAFTYNDEIGQSSSIIWYNYWDDEWGHEIPFTICGYEINNPGHWAGGVNDKYLGVRFYRDGNYHYAWIAIEISAIPNSCTIKEFAYESTPNKPIKAGDNGNTDVDTPNSHFKNITAFPNPSLSGNIVISYYLPISTSVKLNFFDNIGNNIFEIEKFQYAGLNQESIQTINFESGIYYYQIKTRKNFFKGKIVLIK